MKPIKLPRTAKTPAVIVAQHDVQFEPNSYLSVVVVHYPGDKKYVCWGYNHHDRSCNHGHYHHYENSPETYEQPRRNALGHAMSHFMQRVQNYEGINFPNYELR